MMYNPQLDTFICVVEAGSFSKAAEELYISAPAVIKQINSLENSLNLQLFERTHRGLIITEAGKSLYQDAKYLIQYSKESLIRAQEAMIHNEEIIRVGISPMTPPEVFVELWPKIQKIYPEMKFKLITFENTPENAREILANMGKNIDVIAGIFDETMLEDAYSDKTKAVMIAHTLGNPFDLSAVKEFCDKHNLWLVEDNCDALGSKYTINGEEKFTGTIGDIGTSSFYPPHHMTMGEGGAVYTNNPLLNKCIRSFRDWGRDCVCPSGKDNLCGHRFDKQYGELPLGYDHKYVYSHFGYNLKATDMQTAVGCAQLEKFPSFVERRRHNFDRLRAALADIEDKVILPVPCDNSRPSWFGFLITVREGLDRKAIVEYIESHGVQTRNLFAGNLIKHPCFDEMRATGEGYRVVGTLDNTDRIMRDTFWVGVYPGMTDEMIDYMAKTIKEAVNQ